MRRKLFTVVLSSIALFILMGVTFVLSPVVPFLVEDESVISTDASLEADPPSPEISSPKAGDGTGIDLLAARETWISSVVDLSQIDDGVVISAETPLAPSEVDGLGEAGKPDEPSEVDKPSKIESPVETDKPTDLPTEAGKPSKADAPNEADGPSEANVPIETDVPSEADVPIETDGPSEADVPIETDGPSEADVPIETDGPSEADVPIETDMPSEADVPSEAEVPIETNVQMPVQQNVNGQTYVSLSATAQSVDPYAQVNWDGRTMTVTTGGTTVTATSGKVYVVANSRYLYVPNGVKAIDGQIYVPDTVAAKAFSGLQSGDSFYDQNDLFWLSRVIHRESGNQSLEGQMAVGNVILNRVAASAFPSTIEGVLAQENQFPSYHSGALQQTEPSASCIIAAKLVLDGGVVGAARGATYFSSSSDSWAAHNKQFIAALGGHNFYG